MDDEHGKRRRRAGGRRLSRRTLAAYLLAWVAIGTALALVAVAILDDERSPSRRLPPVRQTALAEAARAARCRLVRPGAGERGNPPASGRTAAAPARPGAYSDAPSSDALVAALRRGTIVLQYRPGLSDDLLQLLEAMRAAVPRATILTPNATRMPYQVAVIAYDRILGCPRLTPAALDALRLFRGRFLGSGPES